MPCNMYNHNNMQYLSEKLDWTLHKSVNLCLSCGWLPRVPGNSQSKFIPSKPYVLSSLIDDWINFSLLAAVDTMALNLDI